MNFRHRYRLFGFVVASQRALPELPEAEDGGSAEVSIAWEAPAEGTAGFRLDIEDIARFTIEKGERIFVEPCDGVDDKDVRLFLLGSAMGILLHQRGLLPLHANAVVVEGRAFAFMGRSGSGKSTLAAWFHDRDFELIADDVCLVADAGSAIVAFPGLPRLRLWDDALEASGRSPLNYPPSYTIEEKDEGPVKFDVSLAPESLAAEPVPLAAVFLLDFGTGFAVGRLRGSDAVEALSANTYRGEYIAQVGETAAHVATCVRLAQTIPIYRLERPRDRDQFDVVGEAILDLCRSI